MSAMDESARRVALIRANIRQFTGKNYANLERELEKLSLDALNEMTRLLRDAEGEVRRAKNEAFRTPWRR